MYMSVKLCVVVCVPRVQACAYALKNVLRNACLSVSVIKVYVKMGVYYYNVQVRKYVCMIVFDEGVCCIGKDMLVAIGVRCDVCVQ